MTSNLAPASIRLFVPLCALVLAAALAGCSKKTDPEGTAHAAEPPKPAQPAHVAGPPAGNFAGDYFTNWGSCTFTQQGTAVNGHCDRQYALACTAEGNTLHCDWTSPMHGTKGKTTLTIQPDGEHVTGPWGNGESTSNGGTWIFTHK